MWTLKTILHPTDFSECSEGAFELACSLARERGARLVVLHVVPSVPSVMPGVDVPNLHEADAVEGDLKAYQREMQARLQKLQSPVPGVEIERLFREGDVADEVLRAARETLCDLIITGTHGRSHKEEALMGSVAEAISRYAPCPVVTVRTGIPEAAGSRPAARRAAAR